MAHPDPAFHTADMVRALIDDWRAWPRYETLYGELVVTPAPRLAHQWMVGELFAELREYLLHEPVGVAFMSPADISWGRADVLVQPDVFVIPRRIWELPAQRRQWRAVDHLLLAAEVVSPESERRDRFGKRVLYQRQRTESYWVIDVDRREAQRWTPDADLPQIERERLTWHPKGARTPFVFDLAARFAQLADD